MVKSLPARRPANNAPTSPFFPAAARTEAHGNDRVADELHELGGVVAALQRLSDDILEAGEAVALSVRGVAWELDRERRGDLCVGARRFARKAGAS